MVGTLRKHFVVGAVIAVAAVAVATPGGVALAQKKVLVMATDAAGGVSGTATSGIAKVITERSPLSVRVRSYSSPEAWLPDLDSGRTDLGNHFSATAWLSYNQIESNLKLRNLRLLRSSKAATPLGFMVRRDSDIKSVSDLKGKRVAGGYGAHPIMRRLAGGVMAAHGLDWSDVQMVPVTAAAQGAEALLDGRVDAAWYAVFAPATQEAHTKIGIRFLPIEWTKERLALARKKIFPGVVPITVMANPPYAPKGTVLLSYEYYLMGSVHTDEATVKTVLEALWNHSEEVRKVHPVLSGFTNDAAVTLHPVIPYHPAATAFYKSKGTWSADADAANAALPK